MKRDIEISPLPLLLGGHPADYPILRRYLPLRNTTSRTPFPDARLAGEALRAFQHQGMCSRAFALVNPRAPPATTGTYSNSR